MKPVRDVKAANTPGPITLTLNRIGAAAMTMAFRHTAAAALTVTLSWVTDTGVAVILESVSVGVGITLQRVLGPYGTGHLPAAFQFSLPAGGNWYYEITFWED